MAGGKAKVAPDKQASVAGKAKLAPLGSGSISAAPPSAPLAEKSGQQARVGDEKSTAANPLTSGASNPLTSGASNAGVAAGAAASKAMDAMSVKKYNPKVEKLTPASKLMDDGAFIPMPQDLAGLTVSGWLVPTVKSPFKGLPAFFIAVVLQGCFLGYLMDKMANESTFSSACQSPAIIQAAAVYVFGAAVFNQFTALKGMQIALYTTNLKADGDDTQYAVRETTTRQRRLLFSLTVIDLLVEVLVFGVGVLFLMGSESVADVVLNSVAVNFVSEIDEILLGAFINQAARQRLEKYRFHVPVGIEAGDTNMKKANEKTKRVAKMTEKMPFVWLAVAVAVVATGQGVAIASMGGNHTCTVLSARRDA